MGFGDSTADAAGSVVGVGMGVGLGVNASVIVMSRSIEITSLAVKVHSIGSVRARFEDCICGSKQHKKSTHKT